MSPIQVSSPTLKLVPFPLFVDATVSAVNVVNAPLLAVPLPIGVF